MSTAQNKIIKRLKSKILELEKKLIVVNKEKNTLQDKFSKYITNVKISLEIAN